MLALSWLAPSASLAQVIPGMQYAGAFEGVYQSWEITEGDEETKINQLIVPLSIFLPVTDKADIRIASSYASFGREGSDGSTESVSGVTDVRLQANYAAVQRRLLIGLVANLPTGQGELNNLQQDIVFDFVSPDLSVRANRLGEGFNLGGTLTYAAPVSRATILSLGGGLIYRGAYNTSLPDGETPIELNPGLLGNASLGVDFFTGPSHLHLSSTFSYFGTEQVDGADFYRIGPEIAFVADYGLGYSQGKGQFTAGLHQIIRLKNSSTLSGEFGEEPISTNGSYLAISAANRYAVARTVMLDLSGLVRLVGKNEFDAGDSTVFEGGLGIVVAATHTVQVSLAGRYVSGSGTGFSGLDRSITGFEGVVGIIAQMPG